MRYELRLIPHYRTAVHTQAFCQRYWWVVLWTLQQMIYENKKKTSTCPPPHSGITGWRFLWKTVHPLQRPFYEKLSRDYLLCMLQVNAMLCSFQDKLLHQKCYLHEHSGHGLLPSFSAALYWWTCLVLSGYPWQFSLKKDCDTDIHTKK